MWCENKASKSCLAENCCSQGRLGGCINQRAMLCCFSSDPPLYQRAQQGLNKHGNHIELRPCSASKGCSPEFCCSFETHSFMRGWVGALRRYSEPSCSLQGEGKNRSAIMWGADATAPTRPEKKQVRKKEGNPHLSTGLIWSCLGVLICVCPHWGGPWLLPWTGNSLKPEAVGLLGVLGIRGADRPGEVQGKGHHGTLQHKGKQEQQWGWTALPSLAMGPRAITLLPAPSHAPQSPPSHLEAVPAVLVEA